MLRLYGLVIFNKLDKLLVNPFCIVYDLVCTRQILLLHQVYALLRCFFDNLFGSINIGKEKTLYLHYVKYVK